MSTIIGARNPFNLLPKEWLFVKAFVGPAQCRASRAYELAGYKTTGAASRANASRMLTRPRVKAAIAMELQAMADRMALMASEFGDGL